MDQVVIEPVAPGTGQTSRWMVVIHNNETNSFEEVMGILMQATGCGADEAATETWEAHTFGKSCVHFGTPSACKGAADVISTIGVRTEVVPEWE